MVVLPEELYEPEGAPEEEVTAVKAKKETDQGKPPPRRRTTQKKP
jgi:hypothetical protein